MNKYILIFIYLYFEKVFNNFKYYALVFVYNIRVMRYYIMMYRNG